MHPLQRQGVYPILDPDLCQARGVDPLLLTSLWFSEGIRIFQLRAKGREQESYLSLARMLRSAHPEMRIIANDYLEAALGNRELFAGIHVGQGDLERIGAEGRERLRLVSEEARTGRAKASEGAVSVGGEDGPLSFLTGVSTHNLRELVQVLEGPVRWTYIALGPFFTTSSKHEDLSPVLKREDLPPLFGALQRAGEVSGAMQAAPFPVFIGGITQERAGELLHSLDPYTHLKPALAVIGAAFSLQELRGIRRLLQ